MSDGMVGDPVDDGRPCTPGIVQVCNAVGKAGPEMQERRGGPSRHARPSISGAGANTFKQPKNDTHSGHAVKRHDNRHLGGAGICEAHLHTRSNRRLDQTLRTCAHMFSSMKPVKISCHDVW